MSVSSERATRTIPKSAFPNPKSHKVGFMEEVKFKDISDAAADDALAWFTVKYKLTIK